MINTSAKALGYNLLKSHFPTEKIIKKNNKKNFRTFLTCLVLFKANVEKGEHPEKVVVGKGERYCGTSPRFRKVISVNVLWMSFHDTFRTVIGHLHYTFWMVLVTS